MVSALFWPKSLHVWRNINGRLTFYMNSCLFLTKMWLAESHQIGHLEPSQKTTNFNNKVVTDWTLFFAKSGPTPFWHVFFWCSRIKLLWKTSRIFNISINTTWHNHQNHKKTTRNFTTSENDIFYEISKLLKIDSIFDKNSSLWWSFCLLWFHFYTYLQWNLNI